MKEKTALLLPSLNKSIKGRSRGEGVLILYKKYDSVSVPASGDEDALYDKEDAKHSGNGNACPPSLIQPQGGYNVLHQSQ